MKQPLPPCPKGPYTVSFDEETGTTQILDATGYDVLALENGAQRLVDCANAMPKVFFPAAHVNALEDRVERLEQLRKDAWARVKELEAEIAQLRSLAVPA